MGKAKKATAAKASAGAEPVSDVTQVASDLLVEAAEAIAICDYEPARKLCLQAVKLAETSRDKKDLTDSYEILGTVELEIGELELAREHFLASIKHAEGSEDPSPAPFLYLAQLSDPAESLLHFQSALQLLQAKLASLQAARQAQSAGDGADMDMDEDDEDESEIRRSASRALVGMTELYLTDFCFQEGAEETCEKNLKLALELDPSDPEVYQTLASVRISQQRSDDALQAAQECWKLWRTLDNDDPAYPPSSTRQSLARLFIELKQFADALEILQGLEMEDDEDTDMWYLSGWAWWLLGEVRQEKGVADGEEPPKECWNESRLALENYLKLDAIDPSASNPDQTEHVKELIGKLDGVGVTTVVIDDAEGAEEGWEDESDEEMKE